ncbi:MAG: M48 family metalloprotease [Elusimicrobia bacterium]|nr:M48 family metalloprotease [Elusimicrobiota bacterium]
MKKFISVTLVSALILLAPGIPAYAGAAAIVGSAQTGGGNVAGQAGAVRLGAPTSPARITELGVSPIRLGASLPAPGVHGAGVPLRSKRESGLPDVSLGASVRTLPDVKVDAAPQASPTPLPYIPSSLAKSQAPSEDALDARAEPLKAALQAQDSRDDAAASSLPRLLEQKEQLSLPADKVAAMPAGEAKTAGDRIMDRILGVKAVATAQEPVAGAATALDMGSGLAAPGASGLPGRTNAPPSLSPQAPQAKPGIGRKILGALTSTLRIAGAGGAVLGLQALAVALLPALFGLLPAAAVWAVSSGVLLLPAAAYARYRLSLRDSPRLTKVKWMMDIAIGAFLGAVVLAIPGAATLTAAHFAAAGLPIAGLAAGRFIAGSPLADSLMLWGSLALLPVVLGVGAGALGLGPILGMMMLPVMTTVAFFLGRIIFSAETGRPFSVPGSLQKIRFPSFNWVMIGVVFALMTGYGAVYSNIAFMAWQFLGSRGPAKWDRSRPFWKNLLDFALNFNTLYLGLLAFNIATGFTSPLAFLMLAFSVERASHWAERLLGRFLPKSAPAPSTSAKPAADPDAPAAAPKAWPRYYYWVKTGAVVVSMAAIAVGMAAAVFGFMSLGKYLLIAGGIMALQVFASKWLIKKTMRATPLTEASDPEVYSMIVDLRERINAERAKRGRKPIPMPEMVNVSMGVPNAFATGRSPSSAMVGVTVEIKDMLLNPDSLRGSLTRLIQASDPSTDNFKVFRKAVAGSLPGVSKDATQAELLQAVKSATDAQLKDLGYRGLHGVLAHEMSHVMDRHMLLGAVTGGISSAVAFASYGIMWAVGHAKAALQRLWDRLTGKKPDSRAYVAPLVTGAAMASLLGILRVFAALWVPIVMQIMQMGASRSNEGMADEDGAKLGQDPESLALALGLLMTWRPAPGFFLKNERLPLLIAVAHLMTVNPVQQLHKAQALKLDDMTEMAVGKQDDFLFNLFITHPDTDQRISRLYKMSEALDAGKGK